MKNKFKDADHGLDANLERASLLISNYTFLPSIDFTLTEKIPIVKESAYAEVYEFNEDDTEYSFNIQNLNKYVKFYVKILTKGTSVEQSILRSDLVQCKREFFKNLDEEALSDS